MSVDEPTRHDPMILRASQWGTWIICSCGWKSPNGTPAYAQNAFGLHLLAVAS